jgi:hypothetical protein
MGKQGDREIGCNRDNFPFLVALFPCSPIPHVSVDDLC